MKLIALVPSEEFKAYAGARIRYKRMQPALEILGIELTLQSVNQFQALSEEYDGLIISKCHDARAIVAATAARQRRKLIGVDLFDDYFSNSNDSRLTRYRDWLRQLIEICDFALCSTQAMAEVATHYRSDVPTHVMHDPAEGQDFAAVARRADHKHADFLATGCLKVIWFGVGDNPYFDVGLRDLAAYGSVLGELRRSGASVQLTVLTNPRSLTTRGLGFIKDLPIHAEIGEWSEADERQALGEALLAFLPVSDQRFNRAKSLNRAVTALSAGCQVLSAGYPLYAALDPLIYRDVRGLRDDLLKGHLKLSSQNTSVYRERLTAVASANVEAERLAAFLGGLDRRVEDSPPIVAMVHGHSTRVEAHRAVRATNGLSVASPFCSAKFDFDVVFRGNGDALEMLVSRAATARLLPEARRNLKRTEAVDDGDFRVVSRSKAVGGCAPDAGLSLQLATYALSMRQIESQLAGAFGPCRTVFSETSALPFSVFDA